MNDRRKEFMEHIRGVEEKVEREGKELDIGNIFMAYKVEAESQRREEAAEAEERDK